MEDNEYISTPRTPQAPDVLSVIDFEAPKLDWGGGLSRYIRQRRQQLGLTQQRAAELAGLELSEWIALECGWAPEMPEAMNMLMGIAGTLEISWADLSFLAFMADLVAPKQ